MRVPPVLMLLAVAGVLSFPYPAGADTAAEVQQLKAEIALLKLKLDTAERKLAANAATTQHPDESASRPNKIKPIADLTQILKTFPAEAQPNDDGRWSNTAAAEAEERLRYAVWGLPFQSEIEIYTINVKENPELRQDGSASPWLIEIDLHNEVIEYRNREIKQDISPIKIYADDRRAQRARKLETGDKLRVRGKIVSIRPTVIGRLRGNSPSMLIYLRDVEIPGITK